MGIRPPYHHTPLPPVLQIEQIISLHYYEYEEGFIGVIEDHDFWEMVYVDTGAITCRAGDLRLPLSQGQLILHPPMERHQIITSNQTGSTYIFSFTCPQLRPELFRGQPVRLSESQHDLILQAMQYGRLLFEGPYDELFQPQLYLRKQTPFGGEQLLRNTLEILLVLLVRTAESGAGHSLLQPQHPAPVRRRPRGQAQIVRQIKQILEEHLYGALSVDDLSRAMAFSQSYLEKIFRKDTGQSLMAYYNRLKIDRAQKLIAEKRYTFTQISHLLGFSSVHYFSRAFRRHTGMSPSEYESTVRPGGGA
jgi:AraC-like DNA-binding protein